MTAPTPARSKARSSTRSVRVPSAGSAAGPTSGPRPRPSLPGTGQARWRPVEGWRSLLSGRQPDAILERLLDGDPLRLRGMVAWGIRSGSLFLDADRVQLRVLARIAHEVSIDGPPADGAWVQGHVAGALEDILGLERRAVSLARLGQLCAFADDPGSESFQSLAAPLGLAGADLRFACDAFNRRQAMERAAFFALFVERQSLDDAAAACGLTAVDVAKRARAALMATVDAVRRRQGNTTSEPSVLVPAANGSESKPTSNPNSNPAGDPQ